MRLLNVCPFKVGDVVYWQARPNTHTRIHRISNIEKGMELYFWSENGEEDYWYVDLTDPNHSGIRLLKRGDE